MMRRYETLLVLNPELPEAQTRETIDRARRLLADAGAEDFQLQEWGMRDLAYEIRKHKRGYYVLLEYRATPELVKELERNLKIADEVLRFISVAVAKNARRRPTDEEAAAEGGAVPEGASGEDGAAVREEAGDAPGEAPTAD
jgi:small subunit ribosomal protein S6